MKKIILLLIIILISNVALAQYDINGNYKISGNVGIGTNSPTQKLDVIGNVTFDGPSFSNDRISFESQNGFHRIAFYNLRLYEWEYGADVLTINNGNLGIGTTSPSDKLEIYGGGNLSIKGSTNDAGDIIFKTSNSMQLGRIWTNGSGNSGLYLSSGDNNADIVINESGNIGIGIINPGAKLDIYGGTSNATNLILSANYVDKYRWRMKTTDRGNAIDLDFTVSDHNDSQETLLKLSRSTSTRPEFQFLNNWLVINNGNVGIGVSNPDSKLVVDGKIRSEEIKVEIVNGPDYVFEEDYELRTLEETKEYISENKHLPEIPSAAEMEANGIDLGDMNMKLLQKVEELTLYLIEQNKEITILKEEVKQLKVH